MESDCLAVMVCGEQLDTSQFTATETQSPFLTFISVTELGAKLSKEIPTYQVNHYQKNSL